MKRINLKRWQYRFLSTFLAAVLAASSCSLTQVRVFAQDEEGAAAQQEAPAQVEPSSDSDAAPSENPETAPAVEQQPAAEQQNAPAAAEVPEGTGSLDNAGCQEGQPGEVLNPSQADTALAPADTPAAADVEIQENPDASGTADPLDETNLEENTEESGEENTEGEEKDTEEGEDKEATDEQSAEPEYEEIILSEEMPEVEIPHVLFTLAFVDQDGQPITETAEATGDENAQPLTQTIELTESSPEYALNEENFDVPENYCFLTAEIAGEEAVRLYCTYETVTVEKTIHKLRRVKPASDSEAKSDSPDSSSNTDPIEAGSESAETAGEGAAETASAEAEETEFTETVNVEMKVPSFGYETADGAQHEVTDNTTVTVRCEQTEEIEEEKEEQKIITLHYMIVDEDGNTIGEYSERELPDFDGTMQLGAFPEGEQVTAAQRIGSTNRYYEVVYHYDHSTVNGAPAEWIRKEQSNSTDTGSSSEVDAAQSDAATSSAAYFYGTGEEQHELTENANIVLTYKAQEQSRSFYMYRDDEIEVTVRLSSGDAVPDQAELVVTPIPQGPMQDAYLDALNQNAAQNGTGADAAEDGSTDNGEAYDASNTLLYDIAFMIENPDGGKVEFEPKEGDVNVKFRFLQTQLSDLADEPEQIEVSHLTLSEQVKSQVDATIQAENITADDIHVEQISQDDTTLLDANQIRFETESFSVFGFRVDGQLRKRVISASGATYEIIVTYGADAKIPEDAELEVTEILEEDEGYEETVNRTLEALRENADPDTEVTPSAGKIRIFDISIMSAGKEVQPAAAVDVSAELVGMKADESVSVVHFTEDGDDVITPDDKGSDAICFTTESFSRYVFVDQDGETGDPVTDLAGQSYALTVLVKNKYSTIQSENNPKFSNRRAALQVEVVTVDGKQMIFSDGSETKWTFEPVDPENGVYYVSTMVDGSKKYLTISSTKEGPIILSDTAGEAQEITVTVQDGGRVRLDHGGMAPNLQGDNIANGFRANNYFGDSEKIYLTKATDAFATAYMASVSDLDGIYKVYGQEGSAGDPDKIDQIVLYQSVVNETTGETELYALDGNGELVRVTESGDQIYMAASPDNNWTTPELYWQLVIYVDDLESKNPTGYYQLYNPATGKYLTPSMNGVVSSEDGSVHLTGRDDGAAISTVETWNEGGYFGVHYVNKDGEIVAEPTRSDSRTFRFATTVPKDKDPQAKLDIVDTISSDKIRITMYDFPSRSMMSGIMGTDLYTPTSIQRNLVNRVLANDTKLNQLFNSTYQKGTPSNLFLASVYSETGYYSYNARQNYAWFDEANNRFEVYRQLGTADTADLTYGNFFPYNSLKNPVGNPHHYTSVPTSDPRYMEDIYVAGYANGTKEPKIDYYFGMKLETNFLCAKDGLDEFGNPIIYEFSGDDDLWVYVDGVRILDVGGIHSSQTGRINFQTGAITYSTGESSTIFDEFKAAGIFPNGDAWDPAKVSEHFKMTYDAATGTYSGTPTFDDYTGHSMTMFYMERGAHASNLNVKFNLPTVTPETFKIKKNLADSAQEQYANVFFAYQAFLAGAGPDGSDLPLTSAVITDAKGNTRQATFQQVNLNGVIYDNVFFLKPGESADFTVNEADYPNAKYYARELGLRADDFDSVLINGGVIVDGEEAIPKDGIVSSTVATVISRPLLEFSNTCSEA
ncbi:MAG: hypothetical protein J6M46_01650, partial [Lachnospiraceae bacterium]|nr:hypothetical protein [Lachnospiraceae bacterium]